MQSLAPSVFEYAPVGHAMHTVAPDTFENAPAVQFKHVIELLAPSTLEYCPAGHLVHAPDPDTSEYEPDIQFVQADAPMTAYVALAHGTQDDPALTDPTGQTHSEVSSSRTRPDAHGSTNHAMYSGDNFLR